MAEQQGKSGGFANQKQLRESRQQENLVRLSGDESRDDRVEAANQVSPVDLQPLLGFPFMHPMHDASVDQQFAPRALRRNAERRGEPRAVPGASGHVSDGQGENHR